jgi:hypothetical protein
MLPLLAASTLVLARTADGAAPAGGTVSHESPTVTWTGTVAVPTWTYGGELPCEEAYTCDRFALTIEDLDAAPAPRDRRGPPRLRPDDVVVGISAPSTPAGTVLELDLFVYDPAGQEIGRSVDIGSNETVTLRDVAAGTYNVVVRAVLTSDPAASFEGRATIVDAPPPVPVDGESVCGLDPAPEVREADEDAGIGAYSLLADPTYALDGLEAADRITLSVLVVLDGVTEEAARAIFDVAARSYAPLGIDLEIARFQTHAFHTNDGLKIIRDTKALLGGERPDDVDIVETLVGYDIQQLGQQAIAGIANCIGGVANPDTAFLVAEGIDTIGWTNQLPAHVLVDMLGHISAHEIGHLMGAQHHYANCVEGVEPTDVQDDHVTATPCTLMFNDVTFLSDRFGTFEGTIVRGAASREARP